MSFSFLGIRIYFLLIMLCCFGWVKAFCQDSPKVVPGLPTKEIFDLLVDRKGFLWVGHDMGISRFDGFSFTHFTHPARSSLGVTDLAEDSLGRIWFHNFTGQVFYIENERMNLLEAYEHERENYFPRLVFFQNEILVTSNKGLFVCDTRTLKSHYQHISGKQSSTQSLAVMSDKVLAYHLGQWYLYNKGRGLKKTTLTAPAFISPVDRSLALQKDTKNDTAFLIANPSGTIYKLVIENDKIRLLGVDKEANFINAVQVAGDVLKVHGRESSYEWKDGRLKSINGGSNLSDVVVDKQGNTWYSSLSNGLLVRHSMEDISKIKINSLNDNDEITLLTRSRDNLLIGTKNGYFAELSPTNLETLWKYKIQNDLGSINLIFPINKKEILVSTSVGTFLYDKTEGSLILLYSLLVM